VEQEAMVGRIASGVEARPRCPGKPIDGREEATVGAPLVQLLQVRQDAAVQPAQDQVPRRGVEADGEHALDAHARLLASCGVGTMARMMSPVMCGGACSPRRARMVGGRSRMCAFASTLEPGAIPSPTATTNASAVWLPLRAFGFFPGVGHGMRPKRG